jgi:ABC-type Fe3+-hydroxamate transport system substrate-binding protein
VTALRVVSLVPSVTESLLAWAVRPVAVTRFCEQPDYATVGGTKDPDVEAIVALAPDLVVMNDEENRLVDSEALVAAGLTVHVTHVHTLADVDSCLAALAAAAGVHYEPVGPYRPRTSDVRRRAFVPIWRRPWMTFNDDTYGASLLDALGVDTVFGDAPERYPTVTLDDVIARQADLVLLPSEPYPFAERHRGEFSRVAGDVRLVDGRDLFWWGVRTVGALRRLAEALR